ncbi:MAG: L-2-hydroxyglutarate oxidase [Hyphomicrobiales bacterium]|nr:L-2-hydroxyglutarate oxidase [Hyphomicrobiales bacterium]
MSYDLCIIGGGIVGLATALKFSDAHPNASMVVLEKEGWPGLHQTGHNSGVIHSGIYYAPGSLKARLCRQGAIETEAFCKSKNIANVKCGKMIVATSHADLGRMEVLLTRARQNGVEAEQIDAAELRRREPNITGLGAIFVPGTGIVDYKQVCNAIAHELKKRGVHIVYHAEVSGIEEKGGIVTITTSEDRQWLASCLVVCAGLQSDRLARLAGLKTDFQIIPFRGEYYRLPAARNSIIQSLIYPVPDPSMPFLGIHLTRMIDGGVTAGPNAVLGLSREGYPKFSFSWLDTSEFMTYGGFWKLISTHMKSGWRELRNSLSRQRYLAECRKYCPGLELNDLQPQEAGIRAQAVMQDGSLMHDFLFLESNRMLHVCNAPSPAATSALPIGAMIAEKIAGKLERRSYPAGTIAAG